MFDTVSYQNWSHEGPVNLKLTSALLHFEWENRQYVKTQLRELLLQKNNQEEMVNM